MTREKKGWKEGGMNRQEEEKRRKFDVFMRKAVKEEHYKKDDLLNGNIIHKLNGVYVVKK